MELICIIAEYLITAVFIGAVTVEIIQWRTARREERRGRSD